MNSDFFRGRLQGRLDEQQKKIFEQPKVVEKVVTEIIDNTDYGQLGNYEREIKRLKQEAENRENELSRELTRRHVGANLDELSQSLVYRMGASLFRAHSESITGLNRLCEALQNIEYLARNGLTRISDGAHASRQIMQVYAGVMKNSASMRGTSLEVSGDEKYPSSHLQVFQSQRKIAEVTLSHHASLNKIKDIEILTEWSAPRGS